MCNMNFPENRLNFPSIQNTDPAFVDSFVSHFAFVNPWASYWSAVRSSIVVASEDVFPARSFARSEFCNDWLLPQNKAEAAAGVKIVEAVYLLLHFPLAKSGLYDKAGVEISTASAAAWSGW